MRNDRFISNVEIADCMLRAGGPVTVKRIVELLGKHYPELEVDVPFVRTRLAMFERSKNVICVVNKDTRPATYHMMQIHQEFFRGARNGRVPDFSRTVIPKKNRDTDCAGISKMLRELWNGFERSRLVELTTAH